MVHGGQVSRAPLDTAAAGVGEAGCAAAAGVGDCAFVGNGQGEASSGSDERLPAEHGQQRSTVDGEGGRQVGRIYI
jgi:hypothetical protein